MERESFANHKFNPIHFYSRVVFITMSNIQKEFEPPDMVSLDEPRGVPAITVTSKKRSAAEITPTSSAKKRNMMQCDIETSTTSPSSDNDSDATIDMLDEDGSDVFIAGAPQDVAPSMAGTSANRDDAGDDEVQHPHARQNCTQQKFTQGVSAIQNQSIVLIYYLLMQKIISLFFIFKECQGLNFFLLHIYSCTRRCFPLGVVL